MRAGKLLVIAAAGFLMASCGPALTLNPLFKDSELITDPALLGTWGEEEDVVKFESAGGKTYRVTYRDGKKVSVFEGKLGRLDGQMFLDIYPAPKVARQAETEAYSPLVPMHTVMKVTIEGKQLVVYLLDQDWVEKQSEKGNSLLDAQHVLKAPDNLIITLSTEKLQALVRSCANDKEAFPPSDPLARIE